VNNKEKLKLIFEKSMYLLIMMSVPASVGIACLADKIILTLYTAEFTPSILTLQIFILAVVPMFLNYPAGAILNACDKQGRNTLNMGLTMVLNVVLNLILIPQYQYVGAALASLVSLTILFVLNLGQVSKITSYDSKYLAIKSIKSLFSALIMAAVIIFLKAQFNFVILIILGAIVYLAIMYLIKGFTREDIMFLWQSIFKKAVPSEEETFKT